MNDKVIKVTSAIFVIDDDKRKESVKLNHVTLSEAMNRDDAVEFMKPQAIEAFKKECKIEVSADEILCTSFEGDKV